MNVCGLKQKDKIEYKDFTTLKKCNREYNKKKDRIFNIKKQVIINKFTKVTK